MMHIYIGVISYDIFEFVFSEYLKISFFTCTLQRCLVTLDQKVSPSYYKMRVLLRSQTR